MTAIPVSADCVRVKEDWLKKIIAKYEESDDVFHNQFLSGVIFTGSPNLIVTAGARALLKSMGTVWIATQDITKSKAVPLPGPYFMFSQYLFEIRRLYDDSQGAFMTSVVPGPGR